MRCDPALLCPSYQPFIHNQPGDSSSVRHHLRRIPDVSGESSNPLSSAFTSSNNLSSPLFFNCVCRATVLALVVQRGGGETWTQERYSSKIAWQSFTAPSPFRNLPQSVVRVYYMITMTRRVGERRRTCLRTSRWSSCHTCVLALCIPSRSSKPWWPWSELFPSGK